MVVYFVNISEKLAVSILLTLKMEPVMVSEYLENMFFVACSETALLMSCYNCFKQCGIDILFNLVFSS